MIKYTKTTRAILEFIDTYGFITTRICSNIFYKNKQAGVDQARRKLNLLVENKDIIVSKRKYSKEYIFQRRKAIIPDHKYFLIKLYSQIYSLVDNVMYFKTEEHWNISNKISDGHIIYNNIIDGEQVKRAFLIEIDNHHPTVPDKYIKIYDSNEVQEWYKEKYGDEVFPDVIQVNYNGVPKIEDGDFNVIGLDYEFNGLLQKVIL